VRESPELDSKRFPVSAEEGNLAAEHRFQEGCLEAPRQISRFLLLASTTINRAIGGI
jgi:hypothetical protein